MIVQTEKKLRKERFYICMKNNCEVHMTLFQISIGFHNYQKKTILI